jgi:hypothetical protein
MPTATARKGVPCSLHLSQQAGTGHVTTLRHFVGQSHPFNWAIKLKYISALKENSDPPATAHASSEF